MDETKKTVVVLPCGRCCADCCADCIYMDLNEKNKYGEAWCGKYEKYYSPSENAKYCSYFKQR